jgi:thioredoxin 1
MINWPFSKKSQPINKYVKIPSHPEILNDKNFNNFIEKYPLCLVDFWAPWCSPCKKMSSRILRLSKIFEGQVAFGKLNIKDNKKIAEDFKIMSIPALILFKNGKKTAHLTGVKSTGKIKKVIEKNL